MSFYFAEKTWPELEELLSVQPVVILPIGTTEEHGHHLPVNTDAAIAESFGRKLGERAEATGEVPLLLMETIQYGFSMGIVRRWPGCPNIGVRVFMDYIRDLVRSLIEMGFRKVALLDCHGNHDGALRVVMREIADETGVFIMTLSPFALSAKKYNEIKKDPKGDIHGGEWETSWMLATNPELVKTELYTDVDAIRCDGALRGPVSTWGLQETTTGLFGDPTHAAVETGLAVIDAAVAEGVLLLKEYRQLPEMKSQPPSAAKGRVTQ